MRSYYSYLERDTYIAESDRATYKGITVKTIVLLAILIATAVTTIVALPSIIMNQLQSFIMVLVIASIASFITVLVGRFVSGAAKICSILYSVFEGLLIGTVTGLVELLYPGLGVMAVSGTLVIFAIVFALYAFGIIRAKGKLFAIAMGILLGVVVLALFDFIYSMSHPGYDNFGIVILIQGGLLLYGVISLIFNFAEAESVVQMGCDKREEWSVALGMEVSLVYIYIQLLRLLLAISSRRN